MALWFPPYPNIVVVDTASERSTLWQEGTVCLVRDTGRWSFLKDGAWLYIGDVDFILKAGKKLIFDGD